MQSGESHRSGTALTKIFRQRIRALRGATVRGIADGKLVLDKGEISLRRGLHLDQGLAVTSHAVQGAPWKLTAT